ncbi:ubiquitin carboxyl-terminal hydrolase 13 [Tanacetum coccineum]
MMVVVVVELVFSWCGGCGEEMEAEVRMVLAEWWRRGDDVGVAWDGSGGDVGCGGDNDGGGRRQRQICQEKGGWGGLPGDGGGLPELVVVKSDKIPTTMCKMEDLLYLNGLHQPVFCSEKPEQHNEEEWKLLHRQVCAYIRQCVNDTVLNHVSEEVNARTLWNKLEQLYARKTCNNKLRLIKQLKGLRYCDGTAMSDHLIVFQEIMNNLLEVGIKFKEEVQVLMFLGSLPDSWETFGMSLVNSALDGVISIELVRNSVLDEEMKRKLKDNDRKNDDEINEDCVVTDMEVPYDPLTEVQGAKSLKVASGDATKAETSDILYHEVVDIPLPELQHLKTLEVAFHHATKDEVVIHTIRLPKQSTVGDVINYLKSKVELSHEDAELRLLEMFYNKIYQIFPLNQEIENINDKYRTFRAEEIPEEQKELGPQHRLIHVYHFTKELYEGEWQVDNFGDPFIFVIRDDETLAEIRLRIQKKLQVPDEEFSKWKFAFVSLGNPRYLQDSDVVFTRFENSDVYGAWEEYLGLEHLDNALKWYTNDDDGCFQSPKKEFTADFSVEFAAQRVSVILFVEIYHVQLFVDRRLYLCNVIVTLLYNFVANEEVMPARCGNV